MMMLLYDQVSSVPNPVPGQGRFQTSITGLIFPSAEGYQPGLLSTPQWRAHEFG
jgi:hypothetical protein